MTANRRERELAVLEARLARSRQRAGLPPLRRCPRLDLAAHDHAVDMLRRGYFAHVSPEGTTVAARVARRTRRYAACGENIASGQPDPSSVHAAWMSSRGHRENLLTPGWTDVGLGVALGPGGAPMWVQVFGTASTASVRSAGVGR